jgi:hypothetical protein
VRSDQVPNKALQLDQIPRPKLLYAEAGNSVLVSEADMRTELKLDRLSGFYIDMKVSNT